MIVSCCMLWLQCMDGSQQLFWLAQRHWMDSVMKKGRERCNFYSDLHIQEHIIILCTHAHTCTHTHTHTHTHTSTVWKGWTNATFNILCTCMHAYAVCIRCIYIFYMLANHPQLPITHVCQQNGNGLANGNRTMPFRWNGTERKHHCFWFLLYTYIKAMYYWTLCSWCQHENQKL